MTIHVNIAEAKAKLSNLVKASLRGEEVVIDRRQVADWPYAGALGAADRS
jgi:hypothetical protein